MPTDKPKIVMVNGATGETIERDMTQDEIDALAETFDTDSDA